MMYDKSKVTIVILTKDEGQGLKKIIRSVFPYAQHILVVDGHSKDQTKRIALEEKVEYILDNGKGRGDGVRVGIKTAKTDAVLLFDADGSHDETEIPSYILPILRRQADLVIGSRRLGGSFDLELTLPGIIRSAEADFLTYLVNHKFKTSFSDILYSFRAVNKSVMENINLQSDDFRIEQEMVVSCLNWGLKVLEIPSREKKRRWGKSKLKTREGMKFIFDLIRRLYFY